MKHYDTGNWIGTVLSWGATVWPNIYRPFACWATFAMGCFIMFERMGLRPKGVGAQTLGSAMSFLLVFRANQSYARYWSGRTQVSSFFVVLREFLTACMLQLRGGRRTLAVLNGSSHEDSAAVTADENDARAREVRVNLVRLTIAYAVLLKTYTRIARDGYCFGTMDCETKWRIDWDRLRLRQLLKDDEFMAVDACLGLLDEAGHQDTLADLVAQFRGRSNGGPPASWPDTFDVQLQPAARMHSALPFYLVELIMKNTNDISNSVPWGIKERFVAGLVKMLLQTQLAFDTIAQIITTPIALPYTCLCKTLLTIWMVVFPFELDYTVGVFGGVIVPSLVVLALLGIDAISNELENPFGDDDNDLDILECIHALESEAMELLELTGDVKGRAQFVWRRMPRFIAEQSCKPIRQHLAIASLAAEEVVPSASSTPASSHRSSFASSST